jgi:hypothetical protein
MIGETPGGLMAFIERIEVENEGFLGGLDVSLAPGLNVIIGARGTGKTSLIELVRYGLGAGAFTTEAGTKGEQQAVATLDGGAVTITVRDGDTRWSITRTSEGVSTSTLGEPPSCTVLAQSEVESIGVSASGRLYLIDRFVPDARGTAGRVRAAADGVAVLTHEISSVVGELVKADDALQELFSVEAQLDEAKVVQEQLLASSTASLADQGALRDAQLQLQSLAQRESQLIYAKSAFTELRAESDQMRARVVEVSTSVASLLSEDARTQSRAGRAASLLQEASGEFANALDELSREVDVAAGARAALDESTRALRQTLDTAQAGLSQASRRVLQLEERKGQLDALRLRRLDLQRRIDGLRDRRQLAFDDLESQRQNRLSSRQAVAASLNEALAPQIRVRVVAGERLEAYTSALVGALRGSGLHYNTLAPSLASAVAPFELVDWVERLAVADLAAASGLTADRAASVIGALREADTAAIVASDFEDSVELELLDGLDYKPVEHLSIGQRCTVVLPILMALKGGPLVVDQPEDHLDNAFIASTLITAITNRVSEDQTIFSSHNANIPVLGGADRVIVMESDGESGRVIASGSLDDAAIVHAVSDIMEGGAEAFEKRSRFYGQSGVVA